MRIPRQQLPPLFSLFTSLLGSLSVVFLSLPISLPLCSSPTPSFPPHLPLGSLPTFSFHPCLPLSLPPIPHFHLTSPPASFLVPYPAANSCPLPFPSHPFLSELPPSYLAFPQQQMRFPFTEPPFPASLHLFLLLFLASSLSRSMHSSLFPLRGFVLP